MDEEIKRTIETAIEKFRKTHPEYSVVWREYGDDRDKYVMVTVIDGDADGDGPRISQAISENNLRKFLIGAAYMIDRTLEEMVGELVDYQMYGDDPRAHWVLPEYAADREMVLPEGTAGEKMHLPDWVTDEEKRGKVRDWIAKTFGGKGSK